MLKAKISRSLRSDPIAIFFEMIGESSIADVDEQSDFEKEFEK